EHPLPRAGLARLVHRPDQQNRQNTGQHAQRHRANAPPAPRAATEPHLHPDTRLPPPTQVSTWIARVSEPREDTSMAFTRAAAVLALFLAGCAPTSPRASRGAPAAPAGISFGGGRKVDVYFDISEFFGNM